MGAHPYWYFVPYEDNTDRALQRLREREFEAGRYNPVIHFPDFPLTSASPRPGPKHRSIQAAIQASAEDGTRSILDIRSVGKRADYGVAAPLSNEALRSLYGTPSPTHEMIEENMEFLNDIERGQCIYFTVYKDGVPYELVFAGYSYD